MEQQLKVFIEVVDEKSFTKAGEKLHMTQPAVSQAIAKLEEVMGVRLIERTNKAFYLNKAGEIVYQYAQKIIEKHAQMNHLVEDIQTIPKGPLVIGASYTIGEYMLPEMLVMLYERYPGIIPNVIIGNTEEIGRQLLNHEIDIGLIEGEFVHPAIDKQVFIVDEMYVYMSNRPDFEQDVPATSLENETWIIREEGSGTREQTEMYLDKMHIKPERMYTLGSTQIIKESVEVGLGISMISKWTMRKEMKLGTVQALKLAGTPVTRDLSMIQLKQEFTSKTVKSFAEIIWNYKQNRLD